jgi:hypothetical protein
VPFAAAHESGFGTSRQFAATQHFGRFRRKGLGAESEEKREPASDIDTGAVDSLKALDPDGRLEKRLTQTAD